MGSPRPQSDGPANPGAGKCEKTWCETVAAQGYAPGVCINPNLSHLGPALAQHDSIATTCVCICPFSRLWRDPSAARYVNVLYSTTPCAWDAPHGYGEASWVSPCGAPWSCNCSYGSNIESGTPRSCALRAFAAREGSHGDGGRYQDHCTVQHYRVLTESVEPSDHTAFTKWQLH